MYRVLFFIVLILGLGFVICSFCVVWFRGGLGLDFKRWGEIVELGSWGM